MLSNGNVSTTIPIKGGKTQNLPNCLSIESILRVLSVDKSLALFEALAVGSSGRDVLMSSLDLTRKQYYSRMSALLKTGLIKRQSRSYSLSSFGKMVHDALVMIAKAIEDYWKLAAIDSVQHLPDIGLNKIIDVLIENPEMKESLLREPGVRTNGNNSNTRGGVAKKYASS
jgi:hypothetical protein